MPFSYANPTSGPSAGGIGWFNFAGLTLTPGSSFTGLTGTLSDGTTVTFDIAAEAANQSQYDSSPANVGYFGTFQYTNIAGAPVLYSPINLNPTQNNFLISNIVVKDSLGNPVPNYTVIVTDAEATNELPNYTERWFFNTNGGPWSLFHTINPGAPVPTLTGVGTQSATITGVNTGPTPTLTANYMLATQSPSAVFFSSLGHQGTAIGFATTRVTVQKNIGARIDPADQFTLNLTGTPSATATTTGAASGIQAQTAGVFGIPGNAYTISEAMAPGSVSTLGDYTVVVSAANATPAGSIPPAGNLPITFTPALGDNVTYTILNAAPEVFTKTVDKAFADINEVLTYTISVNNPNNFALNNVLVTDPTPAGTTYLGNITASLPYTGTDLSSGITFTTIPANTTATISWQVRVNALPPVPNPVPNVGSVTVPGGTSGSTNVVTTQVNTAFVAVNKMVDKAFAKVGDVLTYMLLVTNSGNVAANNVVITDAVPAGTTFVPGSVVGATGTPPTLTLPAPLAPGASTMVSFQVQVGSTVPSPNPVPNSASAAYTYTVNPAEPNGASRTAQSNLVNTQVNTAIVSTTKATDKAFAAAGDIITYTLTLSNTGNVAADNVVLTDAVPAGTTFVPGSLTGATGTPPTLTLANPIAAGGSATVTFQVKVDNAIPVPNPVPNSATAVFNYTLNPENPDGATGTSTSNAVSTQVNSAVVSTVKSVDKAYAMPGDVITYTLTLTNSGNTAANNVVITDAVPAGTTFVPGSLIGATGTPPLMALSNPLPVGGTATVTFQVQVGDTIPNPNPVVNLAITAFTFTMDPANPDGAVGTSPSNPVSTQVNAAVVTAAKTADPAFADVNGLITYTVTLQNTGNVAANNVVLTDAVPAGTTFVPGSLTGATGTPPTLTLNAPLAAGGTAVVTYQVKIGSSVPNPNPVANSVSAAFAYTVDPTKPNAASGTVQAGPANTQVNTAKLVVTKTTNKPISYIGDTITYQIAVQNTGNVGANNVVLTDLLPTGVSYVAGSLVVSVPYSGTLASGLALQGSIAPSQIVTVSFQAKVDTIPNPNPILNKATAAYTYTVDPAAPNAVSATASSPAVRTVVFRFNYSQQISDLIESVALEQAALAAIANAEGAKIQAAAAMGDITQQELLCINKSVSDMLESLSLLEAVLKQKLSVVDCQINGANAGCM